MVSNKSGDGRQPLTEPGFLEPKRGGYVGEIQEGRVLVVDDEQEITSLLSDVLRSAGFSVQVAQWPSGVGLVKSNQL